MTTESVGHTRGPWDFGRDYKHGDTTFDLFGPGGQQVIACCSYENMWLANYDKATDAANAQLIAAAPDLLEACQLIRMSFGWQTLSDETKAVLDAAINKATSHAE